VPAITRSRLDEIRSLADAVLQSMAKGTGGALIAQMADFSSAVDEVNASLEDIDTMLVHGLRDESLSMHDPELITVSRLLDMRSRADWIHFYGWLLEHGQSPPPAINIDAAEQFDAAVHETAPFCDQLSRLRRLVLQRAPLKEKIEVLRGLREADPSRSVWVDSLTAHEESRMRELRLLIPEALSQGAIEHIAEIADELNADNWDRPPPRDLCDLLAGAHEAQELTWVAQEAGEIEKSITAFFATDGQTTPHKTDAAIAQRQRLVELAALCDQLMEPISSNPRILEIVRMNGLDRAVDETITRTEASLAQLDSLALVQETKRNFASACQHLEHLCDNPPEKGAESTWLADVQRYDFVARAACQELPDLTMSELLRERIRRSSASVENRELVRRRFWVLTSLAVVGILIVLVSIGGWILLRRTEYSRSVNELQQRVDEARMGMHINRPAIFEEIAQRYSGDVHVEALVAEFDAGLQAEASRVQRFNAHLADHAEYLEVLTVEVAELRTEGEEHWLDVWPVSFQKAATALTEARRLGGLLEKRTAASGKHPEQNGTPSLTTTIARLQEEEEELARAEARQSELERDLSQLAQQAFDARLSQIQDRLTTADDAGSFARLLTDVRGLRKLASSPRSDGPPTTQTGQRIANDGIKVLDAIEARLMSLIRTNSAHKKD
jgi:hypothetical protein